MDSLKNQTWTENFPQANENSGMEALVIILPCFLYYPKQYKGQNLSENLQIMAQGSQ